MYSWEITQLVEKYDHSLPSNIYLEVTSNSPQINRIICNAHHFIHSGKTRDAQKNYDVCWCVFNTFIWQGV